MSMTEAEAKPRPRSCEDQTEARARPGRGQVQVLVLASALASTRTSSGPRLDSVSPQSRTSLDSSRLRLDSSLLVLLLVIWDFASGGRVWSGRGREVEASPRPVPDEARSLDRAGTSTFTYGTVLDRQVQGGTGPGCTLPGYTPPAPRAHSTGVLQN